jgi:transcriptional regulator with XRE-family HTH domain
VLAPVNQTRDIKAMKAFGMRLREVRKSKDLSQQQLAYSADLELSQISRIERGIINTSISQIFQIARALDVHVKYLFDFDVEND